MGRRAGGWVDGVGVVGAAHAATASAHGGRTWGGRVEDEFVHGTASGRVGRPRRGSVARLGRSVGRQFEGGHIPIGPPEPDFC